MAYFIDHQDLSLITDQNINLYDHITLVGDFNIDINKNDLYSNKVIKILSKVAMKQRVMFDTRITINSSTRIDFEYSNDKKLKCDQFEEFQLSNHDLFIFLKLYSYS